MKASVSGSARAVPLSVKTQSHVDSHEDETRESQRIATITGKHMHKLGGRSHGFG